MKNHTGMNIGFLKSLSTLLTTKSLTQISVNEICKETGLSRRTFYNYFSSKEDFLKNSIFIFLDEVTKILYTDLSFSAPVIVEVLTYLQKNQDITRALALHYPDNLPIIKEYVIDIVLSSKKINKQKLKEAYRSKCLCYQCYQRCLRLDSYRFPRKPRRNRYIYQSSRKTLKLYLLRPLTNSFFDSLIINTNTRIFDKNMFYQNHVLERSFYELINHIQYYTNYKGLSPYSILLITQTRFNFFNLN